MGDIEHSTAQKVIARGIASPWSDYDRQAGSILGDLRAAGFEVVPASQLAGAVEALRWYEKRSAALPDYGHRVRLALEVLGVDPPPTTEGQ